MELFMKNLVSAVKASREIIRTSISVIQMSLTLYLIYKMNKAQVEMLNNIEKVNAKMLESMSEINSKVLKNIGKVNSKVESLDLNFINNVKSKESNEVILKMLELQAKTAASHNVPSVNIVNESSTKPVVIGVLILVVVAVSCIWWLAPKVLLITTTQLGKVNLIISELLRFMPGSNSAEATTFLNKLNIKIITTIDKGIPHHKVITSSDKSYGLEEFLTNSSLYPPSYRTGMDGGIPEIMSAVTNSGVDFTSLL